MNPLTDPTWRKGNIKRHSSCRLSVTAPLDVYVRRAALQTPPTSHAQKIKFVVNS